jgi:hypothetical protein
MKRVQWHTLALVVLDIQILLLDGQRSSVYVLTC